MQTVSITVSGKVQGVYYRQSTKEKAEELNLTGLVKNLSNGNVFIVATGTTEQLNMLISWCWEGPRRAKVIEVKVENCVIQRFENFKIER
jgi:acylphosphatase